MDKQPEENVSGITGVPVGVCRLALASIPGGKLTNMTESDLRTLSSIRGIGQVHARTLFKHAKAARAFFFPLIKE